MQTTVVQVSRQGSPEVLRAAEVALLAPGPGEVTLRQTAIGLNYLDVYFRKGEFPRDTPFIPGHEGAGVVEAVGEGVTSLEVGQRAAYHLVMGAYAKRRNLSAERLVSLPDDISDEQAAAVMLKGTTAEYMIRHVYPVKVGDTVLIQAATGGVGSLLTQWAKALGATVIGSVGSEEKAAHFHKLGGDHAVLYRHEDVVGRVKEFTNGEGVPVVFDGVGKATFQASLESLRLEGTLVIIGTASGTPDPVNVRTLNSRSLKLTYPSIAVHTRTHEGLLASANALFDAIRQGDVKVDIGQRFSLQEAAKAHVALEARRTIGSTILIP